MSDDESLRRLRAADPAEGRASDLAALRRAVDDRLADDQGESSTARDELTARRARRSRGTTWMAAAAAAVVVGAGGYLVGLGSAGGSGGAADSAYEGGAYDDSGGAEAQEEAGGDSEMLSADGDAGADLDAATSEGDEITFAEGSGTFDGSGLSDETGSAEAFAYDRTGIDRVRAAEIAGSLGIDGDPGATGSGWAVTGTDGRSVEILADGAATVRYRDPSLDSLACGVRQDGIAQPDGLPSCDPALTPVDPVAVAADFLATVGVEADSLRLEVETSGAGAALVHGYPANAVAPVWSITVTVDGVSSAEGPIAPLVSLGSYDVISPAAAVQRLTDPRFGAESLEVAATRPQRTGEVPDAGDPLPWPTQTWTITDAELTLMPYVLADGVAALLPAWLLTSDDGGSWSVVAVTENALDFVATD